MVVSIKLLTIFANDIFIIKSVYHEIYTNFKINYSRTIKV